MEEDEDLDHNLSFIHLEKISKENPGKVLKGGSLSKILIINGRVIKYYSGDSPRGYEKLKKEADYLKKIPKKARDVFPKLIKTKEREKFFCMVIEYFKNMASLSEEIIKNNAYPSETWNVIEKVLDFMEENFYGEIIDHEESFENYVYRSHFKRVENAISSLLEVDFMKPIMEGNELYVNGEKIKNFTTIYNEIMKSQKALELIKPKKISYFHGNFHMANILTDKKNFALIDPRGEIEGDRDYDISKMLCHLIIRYDEIFEGLFELNEKNDGDFTLNLIDEKIGAKYNHIQKKFVAYETKEKEDFCEWKNKMVLLSGLHAISFSSYHSLKENPDKKRCIAFYILGLLLINRYIKDSETQIDAPLVPYKPN